MAILPAPVLLVRFRKRWVAAFNLATPNREPIGPRTPSFGILTHLGKNQASHRAPLNVFRATEGFLKPAKLAPFLNRRLPLSNFHELEARAVGN